MDILLMTGTINPLCNVGYSNPHVRCKEYERNIEKYIVQSHFDIVIFAENSGYVFDFNKYIELANKYNKVFEYLDLSGLCSSETISIGDAQIMKNALAMSRYLSDESTCIWKVSGRIYIQNINKILKKHKGINENVFLYSRNYDSMQTWFFKVKIKDLKEYFLSEFTHNAMRFKCIEYAWIDCFRYFRNNISVNRFMVYPDSVGINSSGNPYTMSRIKFFLKNILLKLHYFTVK